MTKVLSQPGLTELIQLSKNEFLSKSGAVEATTVQLATVATSGDYDDLTNKPTIPTVNNATLTIQKNSTDVATFTANASSNVTANISVPTDTGDLTNNAGFITGISSSDVTTALGYTPYDSSNPNGYTSNVGTVTSVNNVSPVSGNVTLSIPTVNDATLTITQGGTTKGTFTANASSNVTIDLDSGADTDGDTINTNLNNELQAIGLINQRDGNAIKIWQGTSSQWTNGEATTWYYWQTNVTGGWTSGTIPTSDTWLGMAYGSNRFVIVSGQKNSAYSTDGGETWTTGGNLPNGATSVAYGDGTFVAVMPFSRKTSYSTDGGETWTTGGNLPFSPSFGNNFAFGNGVFVCVDYSRIAYSTNHGVSWSSISLSNNPSYIGFDGEYFILTGGGFDTSYYSQDGVSWSQGGNLPSSGGWDINYNIDNKYVVVSSNGGLTAYTTDHGVTWTEGTSIPYNIGDIACSNNVIVGIYTATSSTNSYYSIDGGETWTASTMQDNQEWRKLAVDNNGKFVAVGVSDKSNSFSIDYQKCYTDTANPTTTSTVYSAPETTSGYTITGASSGAITLSDNNTYYYNQSGNQYTYQSVGTAHPNWLCFINNVGVKIGNTTIATNNSNS